MLLPHKKTWGLMITAFLNHFSLNLILPALVFVFFDAHSHLFPANTSNAVRAHWYGIVSSLPYFAALLATPILSVLSDRLGRRLILILAAIGALVFALGAGVAVVTGCLAFLILGKFTGGLSARSEPTALAAVMDLSEPEERVHHVSFIQVVISLGAFIGPILGGYLTHFYYPVLNLSGPFWLAAVLAIGALYAACLWFKESHRSINQPLTKKAKGLSFGHYLLSHSVRRNLVILLLFQLAWSSYYQFYPPMLKVLKDYSPQQIGWFIGFIAFGLMIATLWFLPWLKRFFQEITLLRLSMGIFIAGFLITFLGTVGVGTGMFSTSLIWMGALLIAVGDVMAFCLLVIFLASGLSSNDYGKMMGFCFMLVYAAWGLTSLVAGYLAGINMHLPLGIAGIVLPFLAYYVWVLSRANLHTPN